MMGSRGSVGGDEHDAFSRRARRLHHYPAGAIRKIKRGYWKRQRKANRNMQLDDAKAERA